MIDMLERIKQAKAWLTVTQPRVQQKTVVNTVKDRSLRGKARRKARQGQ